MALFLTESEVSGLISMGDGVTLVEQCMREAGEGETVNLPRRRLRLSEGMLHFMAAAQPSQGMFALKAYTAFGGKIRFRIFLYDAMNGDILAVIEGDRLGQLRTGAATAVATKYMARTGIHTAGLFGTGFQAEGQIEALLEVLPLKRILVYSRNAEARALFCGRMSEKFGIDVLPVGTPDEAVVDMQLVTTATTSKEPVFNGNLLAPGAHVNAVGANLLIKREIDGKVLRRAHRIVVDTREQAALESGALLQSIEAGHLHWERVDELGDVVSGRIKPRVTGDEITLFHSLGMALWDTATAAFVYRKAREQGRGVEIPLS
jgi:alanine dehydrogenase